MAKPNAPAKKPDPADFKTIKAEADRRLQKAKTEKQRIIDEINEAYSFVMPYRVKPGNSTSTQPGIEATDNFSSLGEEVCTDFASDMADTFIPEHTEWAGVEVAETVPDQLKGDAKIAARMDTATTFAAINASNFHEAGKQAFKDLAVSAFGMAINDPGAGEPIQCQVIPIGELQILRANDGTIGTRFWVRNRTCQEIEELFPDIPLPAKIRTAINTKEHSKLFPVVQGCYRDYSVRAETAWINFTQIDGDVVEGVRKVGIGSAIIIVGRWDPDPNFAWGVGCAIKALADFRELDETNYLKLKGLARQIDPPVAYDDDQVMNLDGGLPNGVAIPRMKGSKIEVIESTHGMDAGLYAVQQVEERIMRHFYQDGPIQKGKTPPTLGQWADESLQKQRRLGTPAAPLWQEFLSEAYLRFRWLLVAAGKLQPVIKVGSETFPVRPINPLKRAANQQKAVASERFLATIAGTFGPNLLPTLVDVGQTVHALNELNDASAVILKTAVSINKSLDDNQKALMAQQSAAAAAPLLKSAQQ